MSKLILQFRSQASSRLSRCEWLSSTIRVRYQPRNCGPCTTSITRSHQSYSTTMLNRRPCWACCTPKRASASRPVLRQRSKIYEKHCSPFCRRISANKANVNMSNGSLFVAPVLTAFVETPGISVDVVPPESDSQSSLASINVGLVFFS